jgi:hypothetical protein
MVVIYIKRYSSDKFVEIIRINRTQSVITYWKGYIIRRLYQDHYQVDYNEYGICFDYYHHFCYLHKQHYLYYLR